MKAWFGWKSRITSISLFIYLFIIIIHKKKNQVEQENFACKKLDTIYLLLSLLFLFKYFDSWCTWGSLIVVVDKLLNIIYITLKSNHFQIYLSM